MDRKECYRLTHTLSKISGYATGYTHTHTHTHTHRFDREMKSRRTH